MHSTLIRRAALVLALALCGAPAISSAATGVSTQPVHVNYQTSITSLVGFSYPYTGRLELTLNPDNLITGYYRPADNNDLIPVTGARDGKNVWLDIGTTGRMHVQGTLNNGVITGTAYDNRSNGAYKFSASIEK